MSEKLKYGDKFTFVDRKTGELPSDCLSHRYSIESGVVLIFIYEDESDGTFMYASKSGQHTRNSDALKYCVRIDEIAAAEARGREEFVNVFGKSIVGSIPESDEYALGWNDCRKEVRSAINRILKSLSPSQGSSKD